jgi:hypothetical protein
MRAKQFIFEYKRDKTAQNLGAKIMAVAEKDNYIRTRHPTQFLAFQNPDKTAKPSKEVQQAKQMVLDIVLKLLEDADPTPQKKYTQWLAKQYAIGETKLEDMISRVADYLHTYNQLKIKNHLAPENKDINRLGVMDVYQLHNQYKDLLVTDDEPIDKGEYKEVLNNAEVRVIVPESEEAACYYGQGTTWCTAARNNNMFDQYRGEGMLYILLPKKPDYDGEKYQISFAAGQYMDEGDAEVNAKKLLTKRFRLLDFFRKTDPDVNEILEFQTDRLLVHGVKIIGELVRDTIMEIYTDLEADDTSYYDWLAGEGYMDEEGMVDWDQVEKDDMNYASYNDNAHEILSIIDEVESPDAYDIRTGILNHTETNGESAKWEDLPDIVGLMVQERNVNDYRIENRLNDIVFDRVNGEFKVKDLGKKIK